MKKKTSPKFNNESHKLILVKQFSELIILAFTLRIHVWLFKMASGSAERLVICISFLQYSCTLQEELIKLATVRGRMVVSKTKMKNFASSGKS